MESITQIIPADFIENFISSFEDQIQKIEAALHSSEAASDASNILFADFQRELQKFREERCQLNEKLRETLALNCSLRKNDYNCLMNEIFILLDRKETEAEKSISVYIDDQKAMARFLIDGILSIKNTPLNGDRKFLAEFKKELNNIVVNQQGQKELAISKLLEFQNIHHIVTGHFKNLLESGDPINCKNLKKIKKNILEVIV